MAQQFARFVGAEAFVFSLFVLVSFLMAVRQGIFWWLQILFWGALGVFAINAISVASRNPALQRFSAFGAGLGFLIVKQRSRHIPACERRKVIARFERSGKKHNSRKHHLDHRVAFARGGSNTADNLRVLDKKENLRKGKKAPRLRDWFWR